MVSTVKMWVLDSVVLPLKSVARTNIECCPSGRAVSWISCHLPVEPPPITVASPKYEWLTNTSTMHLASTVPEYTGVLSLMRALFGGEIRVGLHSAWMTVRFASLERLEESLRDRAGFTSSGRSQFARRRKNREMTAASGLCIKCLS
jgi:hypothetical protein